MADLPWSDLSPVNFQWWRIIMIGSLFNRQTNQILLSRAAAIGI
jgi:hypothetical protein